MKKYFLEGSLVGLRPYNHSDFSQIHHWVNDEETTHYMFTGQKPTTLDQVVSHYTEEFTDASNVVFIVEEKESSTVVGMAGLYGINASSRKAEFRILLGTGRGKGLGTDTTCVVTQYGFDRLNLHRIFLGVTGANKGAVRTYEKAGYITEGVLKDDIYRNGRYYNSIRMACLRGER